MPFEFERPPFSLWLLIRAASDINFRPEQGKSELGRYDRLIGSRYCYFKEAGMIFPTSDPLTL